MLEYQVLRSGLNTNIELMNHSDSSHIVQSCLVTPEFAHYMRAMVVAVNVWMFRTTEGEGILILTAYSANYAPGPVCEEANRAKLDTQKFNTWVTVFVLGQLLSTFLSLLPSLLGSAGSIKALIVIEWKNNREIIRAVSVLCLIHVGRRGS